MKDRIACLERECAELKEEIARLKKIAHFDGPTGVLRKEHFGDRAQAVLDKLSRTSQSATILFLDLDNFKKVNDTLGHHVGDQVLEKISAVIREYDIAGRLGGDEFAILLPNVDLRDAQIIAERIRVEIEGMQLTTGEGEIVTLSIGLSSTASSTQHALSELFEQADSAMYIAKRTGRNRVVCFAA